MSKATENEALIRAYIETARAASADPAAGARHAARYYHPEIVCEWTGRSPFAGTYSGREFFEEWAPRWAAYDVTIGDVIDVLASDQRVAVLVVEEYRHRESGEVLRIDRLSMYEIEDGKIKSMTVRDEDQYASDEFWTRTCG
jgi:ketosteroid isomerase-like protein